MGNVPFDMVQEVRRLHRPVRHGGLWLECRGCDPGSRAEDYADWPCATADVVYSATERANGESFAIDSEEG